MEVIKNLIFSTPLLRVLDVLLHQREELDDQTILQKVQGVKRSAVHQALIRLNEFGVLERTRKGRRCSNILRFSYAWLLYFKIASNLLELEPLLELLKPITTKIVLFGSRAQGSNDEESDFDLLAITSQGSEVMHIVNRHELNDRLQILIKSEGDMLQLEETEPLFIKNIREGIIVWEA